MGTTFRIVLYAPDSPHADRAFHRPSSASRRSTAALSDYRDSSELSRITRDAVDAPTPISDRSFQRAECLTGLARDRAGAFDITIGSLSRLGAGLAGRSNCLSTPTSPPREQ
jgi:thiamine biosynthesis lipoprotein